MELGGTENIVCGVTKFHIITTCCEKKYYEIHTVSKSGVDIISFCASLPSLPALPQVSSMTAQQRRAVCELGTDARCASVAEAMEIAQPAAVCASH